VKAGTENNFTFLKDLLSAAWFICGTRNATPNQDERKTMKDRFDELAKNMAQSVTRRAALKKFSVGLAGIAFACFGLANRAEAGKIGYCLPTGVFCQKGSTPCCHGGCRGSAQGFGVCG
jgi:hypothetical protein